MNAAYRRHLIHYLLVGALVVSTGLGIILLDGTWLQWVLLGTIGLAYFGWGLWHHAEDGSLNRTVVLEYGSMIAVILVVLLLLA